MTGKIINQTIGISGVTFIQSINQSIKIIKIYLKYFGFLLTRLLIKDDGSFPALFAFFDLRDVLVFLKNNKKNSLMKNSLTRETRDKVLIDSIF